ncbi:DUF3322 domain-containing protein [Brevundimonas sp. M20]|uniref:DUF3322 domain-containing protein n=1 Tax=Brevundimonas sp. M20 TaxID=2591463 RepID=UPI0011469DDB|nr:DUF3322 domain-containing protein [Brevundimonas sp. M20]QDH74245.1 hypothetical protein FKQ52_12935 [Brevundimonas sp. M20]
MTSLNPWTPPEAVEAAVLKLWAKGRILAAAVGGDDVFPLTLRIRGPESSAVAARFGEVQAWIRALEAGSRAVRGFGYDIVWREVRHRQLGRNRIPNELVVPSAAEGLKLIRKQAEAARFSSLAAATFETHTELKPWLARKPLVALEHARDWPRILAVLTWFRDHPASGLYLRQVDIPGIDTKFVEARKGLLSELLDVVLGRVPVAAAAGVPSSFEGRYGLRSKPSAIRFRLLDEETSLQGLTDISCPTEEFTRLRVNPGLVFITENDVNGLAFPNVRDAIVVFGLGYSLDRLAGAEWMQRSRLIYWGDIDTHGFAMLARLRSYFPAVESMLMDEATLLNHRALWVGEDRPFLGDLSLLTDAERQLFEDLKTNRFGERLRLEQERIAFGALLATLRTLAF